MVRLLSTLALVCAAFVSVSAHPATAQSSQAKLLHVIVQLKGSPAATDHAFSARSAATHHRLRFDPSLKPARWYSGALQRYQDQEISYLHGLGLDLTVGYRMHVLFNGFTATIPANELGRLQRSLNIEAVLPQRKIYPLIGRSVPLVNAPAAWAESGGAPQAGRGMMIAQVDTGIDIHNPCFNDKGYPPSPIGRRSDTKDNYQYTNNKVIVARAFGSNPNKTYSAEDTEGHGTFGAAIEACDYGTKTPVDSSVSGVAPDAYLLSYNVFPGDDNGTGGYDNLLPALETAVLDGADVINMSLGYPFGAGDYRLDFDELAVENAIHAGVPVVVSAGNAGPTPQTVQSPSGAPDAISVGATTNSRGLYATVDVGGPDPAPAALAKIRAKQETNTFPSPVGPAQVVYVNHARVPGNDPNDLSANDFAGKDVRGKIVMFERHTPLTVVATSVFNAQNAGALGAIVIDDSPAQPGPRSFVLTDSDKLPTLSLTNREGHALLDWINSHPDATVTLDPKISSFEIAGDVLSDFSSRGYSSNYAIKPEIVAPGEEIYSATETSTKSDMSDPSGFTSADGTSFSAPHVTGAIALLLQTHPKWTPAIVKAVLMQTANTSVYLDAAKTQTAPVTDIGGGRLDVGAADSTSAYVLPQSLNFGGVNSGSGVTSQTATVSLSDVGTGSGAWQVSVQPEGNSAGVTLTPPSTVTLPSNGKVNVPVQLSVSAGAASGDYQGYVYLSHGDKQLHVPYLVHVANQRVTPGSVLLVDDSTSLFQADSDSPPVTHTDVSGYYRSALSAIGKSYTYWDEGKLGGPTLQDMKQASAVIYFTGKNVNAWTFQNNNYENLVPPITGTDVTALDDYLRQGGHLFVTGIGAPSSDPYWLLVMLGAEANSTSLFDTPANDPKHTGGISPPQPTTMPDTGVGLYSHVGPFVGLKAIDLSTKGDGAKTNLAFYSKNNDFTDFGGLVGVAPLKPVTSSFPIWGRTYGQGALTTSLVYGRQDVGVVSSDEPSFSRAATYTGRSVLFSFGFEGINDNTGYATRAQVLRRVFQWLDDKPTAQVTARSFRAHAASTLQARVTATAPAKPAVYIWQVGSKTLKGTNKPTQFRFPHAGSYRVRVQVTDTLGHTAVSAWTTVKAR